MDDIKFDFDDILLMPSISSKINSRYSDVVLPKQLPLFTAPMDTVVNLNNMDLFTKEGISVCLPRTIKYDDFIDNFLSILFKNFYDEIDPNTFISLGFNDVENNLKNKFSNFHENAKILLDVANGHNEKIVEYTKEIKLLRPDIIIMVGNIANPKTYTWYAENNCVDIIRTGIGAGSGCLTTKNSSIGYPMASLIHETYLEKQEFIKYNPTIKAPIIVADGGMKDYSDIVKALALGADMVMAGSIFNKCIESCGDNYLYGIKLNQNIATFLYDRGFTIKKYFRGMSTKAAQKAMGKTNLKTSEGVIRYRNVEYHLGGWVENFRHYLRNAMSYSNARTLDEFIGKANWIRISQRSYDRFNK